MTRVYLLSGSNMGSREDMLHQAIALIEKEAGTILRKSPIYEAEAWGHHEQDPFLNQVLLVNTELNPTELLTSILNIELKMGRQRFDKWHQRIIDIDILFYGDQIINLPDLNIPHPHISERRFTLIPLVALNPDFIHPECNKTMKELLDECSDPLKVKIFKH
jgi:2-amino-4-hydroxy-6-hydroxymethyldihydropteridine diphosphokinase